MKAKRYDYYQVTLPSDYRLTMDGLREAAIAEVQSRVRLAITLCEWEAWPIKGSMSDSEVTFRVRRIRNAESIYLPW